MLSRNYRLRKKEVERLFKKGQFKKGANFTIKYLKNRAGHFRVAIVIPKKVIAKATDRNRLKRKIAETLNEQQLGAIDICLTLKNQIGEDNLAKAICEMASLIK